MNAFRFHVIFHPQWKTSKKVIASAATVAPEAEAPKATTATVLDGAPLIGNARTVRFAIMVVALTSAKVARTEGNKSSRVIARKRRLPEVQGRSLLAEELTGHDSRSVSSDCLKMIK